MAYVACSEHSVVLHAQYELIVLGQSPQLKSYNCSVPASAGLSLWEMFSIAFCVLFFFLSSFCPIYAFPLYGTAADTIEVTRIDTHILAQNEVRWLGHPF